MARCYGIRIADGSEAQKSNISQMKVLGRPRLHQAQIGHPDENKSGRTRDERNDRWARNARDGATPVRGSKPARGAENPGALPGEKRKEGGDRAKGARKRIARPGRECPSCIAEHRAERGASVHDARVDDTVEAVVLDFGWICPERADRLRRSHPPGRSKMTGVASYRSRHLGDELQRKDRTTHPAHPPHSSRTVWIALQRKPARA